MKKNEKDAKAEKGTAIWVLLNTFFLINWKDAKTEKEKLQSGLLRSPSLIDPLASLHIFGTRYKSETFKEIKVIALQFTLSLKLLLFHYIFLQKSKRENKKPPY